MNLDCQNCGAALVVAERERTAKCPYCASPQIVERPETRDRPRPTFTIPFALGEGPARELVKGWLKTRGFFRDPKLKTASIDDMRGVYVPAYLYAAKAHSTYSAQIGEDYTETETYTETDSEGKTQTKTRTVTHTEWRSLAGEHSAYVLDVLVTASRGLLNHELEAIEPFDLRQVRRHDDALIAGWVAEEPTLSPEECVKAARDEAVQKIGASLSRFMPGDRHGSLQYRTRLEHETADPMYVPVWVLAARHDRAKPPVRLLVNGQSGAVFGQAPLSRSRVALAIALALLAVALPFVIAFVGGRR